MLIARELAALHPQADVTVHVVASYFEFVESVSAEVESVVCGSTAERNIALCGGRTPEDAYARIADRATEADSDGWEGIHLYLTDERWVARGADASNAAMIGATLLSSEVTARARFHPVDLDASSPETAAVSYAELLENRGIGPGHDRGLHLAVLGVGEDGHVASMFPSSQAWSDRSATVIATEAAGAPATKRVTMTLSVLESAARAVFLVSGAEKMEALRKILCGQPDLPTTALRPRHAVRWIIHQKALA